MGVFGEWGSFVREARQHFHEVGAVLPSSRFLARALVSEMKKPRAPGRILEVGPGTGSVTAAIVKHMLPEDRLDLVELNPQFVSHLQKRFEREERFACRRDQVAILNKPVQDLVGESTYDFIISGLPLNIFPVHLVREIYRVFRRVLKPGGTLSYFEYILVRELKSPFVGRRERRRLLSVGRVVGKYIGTYQIRQQRVFINVPPAVARHLQLKPLPDGDGRKCLVQQS
ncbi:MAG TPA: methyltransferase domain-containing protein [Gemmataceae bacterium]|jgi:phospholipid N-methyltransferase|nr:methyltransferase domain-containing protein [Gemmataceae bacterium]